jgi:transposase
MVRLFWLSDEAWAAIEPHLPRGKPGRPRVDDRRVISGILHVLKVGCRWRDVPCEYGPATTIYNRYNRWSRRRRCWEGRIGADARSRLKPPDRENPLWPVHLECVLLVGTGSARKASWPAAHVRAATKAEHMAAPTSELQRS